MYDNAIRHHRGESIDAHLKRISGLWSRFNDVAQGNPNAWIRDNFSARDIRTPSPRNRPVSFPYTKLMNSNMAVDMSAALILCSVGKARALGIPEDLWVYPHAGVEGYDHFSASVRDNFYTSPGIRIVGHRVLELADTSVCELALVDLYSCFPAAVQIAAQELGLPETSQLTVTGGLTFGGGPLNNYVMHSVARMVELLRKQPGKRGLITANGGNLYKHAHCVYSSEPPVRDFQFENVQARIDELPARECVADYRGDVEIESYTVMYRGDDLDTGHCACLTPDGARTWANTRDPEVMLAMTCEEFCGRSARIDGNGTITMR
jgi:acetyl-CoA C-acetyltransferase